MDEMEVLDKLASVDGFIPSLMVRAFAKISFPIPIALIGTDVEGTVNLWSPYAEVMYGWSAEEVLGSSIFDLTVGTDSTEQAEQIMANLSEGKAWQGEFRARRRDGTPIDVHVVDLPTRDTNGEIDGVCGFSVDVTVERQVLEERIGRSQIVITALENAREMERRRIAGELHDEIGQQLSALRTTLLGIREEQADPQRVDQLTGSAVERLDDALAEVRRICAELRPVLLDVAGLGLAVRSLADQMRERTGLDVDVDVDGYCGGLDDAVELQLYRIAQECLTNVERHSGADRVTVTLLTDVDEHRHGASIVLEVTDDGVGIQEGDCADGSGLHIIDERARRIGADLSVTHLRDDTGTRVRVTVDHRAHDCTGAQGDRVH